MPLLIIYYNHLHQIAGGIVGNAEGRSAISLFRNHIVVGIGLDIGNGIEDKAAIGEVCGAPVGAAGDHIALRIRSCQQECKLIVQQHTTGQDLVATDTVANFLGFIGIVEYHSIAHRIEYAVASLQLAVHIRDRNMDHKMGLVQGQTIAVGAGLYDGIAVSSHLVEGQKAVKVDLAGCFVRALQQDGIAVEQPEGELPRHLVTTGQHLADEVDRQLHRFGGIGVGKDGDLRGFIAIDAHQLGGGNASAGSHLNHHLVGLCGISHALDAAIRDDLFQNICVDAHIILGVVQQETSLTHTVGKLRLRHQGITLI